MTEYKPGDKVVVLGKVEDTTCKRFIVSLPNECGGTVKFLEESEILGKLEDFQPKEEKIKFTPEMKEEFDGLKSRYADLYSAMDALMEKDDHNVLKKYLFLDSLPDNANQYQFSLAWEKPSRIEVIEPEKHEVKMGVQKMYLNKAGIFMFSLALRLKHNFTLEEVDQAEKQLGIQGLQDKWHEAAKEDRE
ncbi:hypothetical protein [Liquorilactobacillus hordei]|uniref:hypothetical protein n=1 Tax=Liquorilactobacillus hordei TaxID=468911 RepID=UPI0039ED6905